MTRTWGTGKHNFGYVPSPPEYDECYGYWDNPERFSYNGCLGCANYDECEKASEEDYSYRINEQK